MSSSCMDTLWSGHQTLRNKQHCGTDILLHTLHYCDSSYVHCCPLQYNWCWFRPDICKCHVGFLFYFLCFFLCLDLDTRICVRRCFITCLCVLLAAVARATCLTWHVAYSLSHAFAVIHWMLPCSQQFILLILSSLVDWLLPCVRMAWLVATLIAVAVIYAPNLLLAFIIYASVWGVPGYFSPYLH